MRIEITVSLLSFAAGFLLCGTPSAYISGAVRPDPEVGISREELQFKYGIGFEYSKGTIRDWKEPEYQNVDEVLIYPSGRGHGRIYTIVNGKTTNVIYE